MDTDEKMKKFLKIIPKADIHVHLDGSIRVSTLIEIAKLRNIALPSFNEEELLKTVFKKQYNDLVDYLQGFKYTTAIMQTAADIERVSYEFCVDSFEDGVHFVEPRFAPQQHINENLNIEQVMVAVDNGMRKAKTEYNMKPSVCDGSQPGYDYGIIACALRFLPPGISKYFDDFLKCHEYCEPSRVSALASNELIQAMAKIRDKYNLPIVALDLAGAEYGYHAMEHVEAFQYALSKYFNRTIHAGESDWPQSIYQAITKCHAERIGHGYHLLDYIDLIDPGIPDPHTYVENLLKFMEKQQITVEVCLTSNLQTHPGLQSLKKHPCRQMLRHNLPIAFCTDNRMISRTTCSEELYKAMVEFNLSLDEVKACVFNGLKAGFFPCSNREKKEFLEKCNSYYDKVVKEFGF